MASESECVLSQNRGDNLKRRWRVTGTGTLFRCGRVKQRKLLVSKRCFNAFMFLVLREDDKDDNVEGTMRGREGG